MVSEATLKRATDRLIVRFQPEKIILFGSQARGAATSHSDVDLLVLCDSQGRRRKLMVEMDRALGGMGFAKDIVVMPAEEYEEYRQLPGTLACAASREGRVLYEKHTTP